MDIKETAEKVVDKVKELGEDVVDSKETKDFVKDQKHLVADSLKDTAKKLEK